jgi:hypothetical protein
MGSPVAGLEDAYQRRLGRQAAITAETVKRRVLARLLQRIALRLYPILGVKQAREVAIDVLQESLQGTDAPRAGADRHGRDCDAGRPEFDLF